MNYKRPLHWLSLINQAARHWKMPASFLSFCEIISDYRSWGSSISNENVTDGFLISSAQDKVKLSPLILLFKGLL